MQAVFLKSTIFVENKIINKQKRLVTIISFHELDHYLFLQFYFFYKENTKNVLVHIIAQELVIVVQYLGISYRYYLKSEDLGITMSELLNLNISVTKL
jgi:hypothetical protein